MIGYLRVSTREQADSGAGLAAQRSAIAGEAERRGWDVVWIEDAGESGKSMKRDGITRALAMLKRCEASALVVAKLDRLSRSVIDFAGVMSVAGKQGWAVVALDLGVDMTTPAGRLVAPVEVQRRIVSLSASGLSGAAIARLLDSEGVPTPNRGAQWYPSTVRRMVASARLQGFPAA